MDLSGPWPTSSKGNKYILVVTDHFSKWLEMYPLPDKTARGVAEKLHLFVSRYGVMGSLHSDRGTEFTADVVSNLCTMLGVKRTLTSGYTPWSNAQVERHNRTIRGMVTTITRDCNKEWDECLPWVMQAYNGTEHASTGRTPFLLFHSRTEDPRLPIDMLLGPVAEAPHEQAWSCYGLYVEQTRVRVQKIFKAVRAQLQKSASMQQAAYGKAGLRIHKYSQGSEVWYWYPPQGRKFGKLSCPWSGPYKVTATEPGHNLVQLELGDTVSRKRWVNCGNVKPVRRMENGDLF